MPYYRVQALFMAGVASVEWVEVALELGRYVDEEA